MMKYIKEYGTSIKNPLLIYTKDDLRSLKDFISMKYDLLGELYGDFNFQDPNKKELSTIHDIMGVTIKLDLPIKRRIRMTILFAQYYDCSNEEFGYDRMDALVYLQDDTDVIVSGSEFNNSWLWCTPYQMSQIPRYIVYGTHLHPLMPALTKKLQGHREKTLMFDTKWERYWSDRIRENPKIFIALKECRLDTPVFKKIYDDTIGTDGLINKISSN